MFKDLNKLADACMSVRKESLNESESVNPDAKVDTDSMYPEENMPFFSWMNKEYDKGKTEVKVVMSNGDSKFKPHEELQNLDDETKDLEPTSYGNSIPVKKAKVEEFEPTKYGSGGSKSESSKSESDEKEDKDEKPEKEDKDKDEKEPKGTETESDDTPKKKPFKFKLKKFE